MSWLSASELECAVAACSDPTAGLAFRGVYPHNRLPTALLPPPPAQLRLPLTLIVNTDTHNLPGRHWTSVYIDANRRGELFDTLTTPPSAHVVRFLTQHCQRWTTNRLIYQSPSSSLVLGNQKGSFSLAPNKM